MGATVGAWVEGGAFVAVAVGAGAAGVAVGLAAGGEVGTLAGVGDGVGVASEQATKTNVSSRARGMASLLLAILNRCAQAILYRNC